MLFFSNNIPPPFPNHDVDLRPAQHPPSFPEPPPFAQEAAFNHIPVSDIAMSHPLPG